MIEPELLEAVRRAPADDAPRFAYAELLSSHGDPLGEYIHLACDNAKRRALGDLGDRYVTQMLREWALLGEHRSTWLRAMGLVERQHTSYRWERGFVSEVSTDPEAALAMRAALATLPIQMLQISYPTRGDVAGLVGTGVLGAAPRLMIDQVSPIDDPLDADAVRAIVQAPALRSVESLALCLHRFPTGLDAVTGAPCLSGARSLRFGDAIGAAALLSAIGTWSPSVRELCVTTDGVPLDAYRRVLADPALAELEDLSILGHRDGEGDVFAHALASAPLRRLSSLYAMDLSEDGVDALLRTPVIAGLRSLRLRDVTLAGGSVRKLVEVARGMEDLALPGVSIDQGAVDAIAAHAPRALRKLSLDTSSKGIDLRPLVTSSRYALRELDVRADGVDDDFIAALAASPFAKSLGSLTFSGPVTARGARALAASRDLLPGLAVLWRGHSTDDAGTRAVEQRFPLACHTM